MSNIHYPKEWWDFMGVTPPPTKKEYTDPPEEEVVRIVTRILNTYLGDEERHFEESGKPEGHLYLDLLVLKAGLENHNESNKT